MPFTLIFNPSILKRKCIQGHPWKEYARDVYLREANYLQTGKCVQRFYTYTVSTYIFSEMLARNLNASKQTVDQNCLIHMLNWDAFSNLTFKKARKTDPRPNVSI